VRTPALADVAAVALTPREMEVARLAADGMSSRELAERLGISVRTVDNHLGTVYAKLGVSTREELPSVIGTRLPE
jgi:DNA-binding CsgD family transcriptional regulator